MAIPIPVPDDLSAPFWEAAGRHALVMQKCGECGWYAYPPTLFCGNCLSPTAPREWEPVSGAGRLKSWTVMHQAFLPGFDDDLPYAVGDVELAEQAGLRMIARLELVEPEQLTLGMALQVSFVDVAEGLALPRFRPVGTL